jgi:anthraniloyl-CoA monooxygenase
MAAKSHRWDDIEIHYQGEVLRSGGHGFSGLSRTVLLDILARRCRALGVTLCYQREITDFEALQREHDLVLAADGVNSLVRDRYASEFRPHIDVRPNRFVWLGTTRPYPAFTFYFKHDAHGLWRVHTYQYEPNRSTFIVEAREPTWRDAGLEQPTRPPRSRSASDCSPTSSRAIRCSRTVDLAQLPDDPQRIVAPRQPRARRAMPRTPRTSRSARAPSSRWRTRSRSPTRSARTARFPRRSRRTRPRAGPPVESLQRAAQASLQWFEDTERYMRLEPIQFAFTLLTRSLRVTHENLKARDPAFVARVDAWFEQQGGAAGRRRGTARQCSPEASDVHAVPPARPGVAEPCRRLADVPVLRRGRRAERLAPRALGSRAMGGAGLVFAEMTDVCPEARISPGCTGLWSTEQLPAWRRIVEFVHRETPAKIAMQLGHAGRKAATQRMWEGDNEPLEQGAWPLIAPSPLPYFPYSQVPREMTRADMDAVIADYVRSAGYAAELGFDLLELHMAHGYLLATFISPLTNLRNDDYGGALENRMRFPLEVFDAVRATWPAERPMSVRISAVDWYPGGHGPTTQSTSRGCSTRTAATSSTCRPDRRWRISARSTGGCSRRRSPTVSATRSASRRWPWATSRRTPTSTRSSPRAAPTCACWRARICGIPTGRGTRPTSWATRCRGPANTTR